ncbi:hypothetical protein BJ741DRAFT_681038 [Chytriomyces cf. hyalinus JEL632]|nr:hypothetical protein BJ741DRAFT_681038 [Chytriomyces cf. hyalinus JEL632]
MSLQYTPSHIWNELLGSFIKLASPHIGKSALSYHRHRDLWDRHFVAHFGLTILSAVDVWLIVEKFFKNYQLLKIHYLWALHYLKVYPTEAVAAAKFNTSESNWRDKVFYSISCFGFMDEIHFEDQFEHWSCTQPSCYVDGVDMMVSEARPLDKDLFSHKFKRAGYRYQVAVALGTSKIVYVGGGVLCGKWLDLTMACQTLLCLNGPGERIAADQGYIGDLRLITKMPPTSAATIAHNHNLRQMGSHHETNLKRILKIDDEVMKSLDAKLVQMYAVSEFDKHLCGLLLSRSAFYIKVNNLQYPVHWEKDMDDTFYEATPGVFAPVQKDMMQIAMCLECWKHISGENSTSLSSKKPAEAIANGNWIGYLPEEFVNVSRTTESVVSLMQLCISLSSVIGNSSRKTIKSHHYISVFDQPVLCHLPAMPWDHLQVTFVGSFATEEFAQMQARYSVQNFAGDLLSFFEKHNKWHKEHADLIRPAAAGNYDFGEVHIDRTDTSSVPVNVHLVQMLNHTTYNTGCADTAFEEATAHILHSSTGNPNVEQSQAEPRDNRSAD